MLVDASFDVSLFAFHFTTMYNVGCYSHTTQLGLCRQYNGSRIVCIAIDIGHHRMNEVPLLGLGRMNWQQPRIVR
jgi:hypothetical protein